MTTAYIRVSTSKQDTDSQRHAILEWAHQEGVKIDSFLEVEASATKAQEKRKITELLESIQPKSTLVVTELSRLGRNMLEVLNLIEQINAKGARIVFVRQPELSTLQSDKSLQRLILAIYGYLAEAEREFISMRTKQGLEAAKAKGVKLGRPQGSRNRERKADPYREQISHLLDAGVNVANIQKIIQAGGTEISYTALDSYIKNEFRPTCI